MNSLVASDRDLPGVVAGLRQRIAITAQPDGAIEIKATSNVSGFSNGQNARTAAATVQGLIDSLVEQNLSGDRRETTQGLQFLDEELRRREVRLQEAEQRRVEFESRFMGVLPGVGSIADRMAAARAELANLEQQIAAGQGALTSMRAQLAATPQSLPGVGGNDGSASGQVAMLEAQVAQYLARGWTRTIPISSMPASRSRGCVPTRRRSGAAAIPAACPIRAMSRCAR